MKKIIIIAILVAAGIIFYKSGKLTPYIKNIVSKTGYAKPQLKDKTQNKKQKNRLPKSPSAQKKPVESVTLYFKDGSVMEGELIKEAKDTVVVLWKGSELVVYVDQLKEIKRGKGALQTKAVLSNEEIARYWPYKNDIVIRLTNNAVLDAKITQVGQDSIIIAYDVEGGGHIEQDVERAKIEYLIFKPIDNQESKRIEGQLAELFPKMKFYKEGSFVIVTDSYINWVKSYQKALRDAYTNIYLKFFQLFKDRKPQVDNFVVIFDDYYDFVEYAIADGVPGWAVAGYFSPTQKVLYLFNVLGDRFSKILFEALVGESGRKIDDIVDRIDARVDDRYRIFIEGNAKVIKDKYWKAYDYYKGMYRESTMNTLRHEFAHELFHNWGLQNIVLSKFERDETERIKKKKEFLQTDDYNKKAKLLRSLVSLREEAVDMKAANSWISEGIATYCETDPLGSQNNRWLYIYQDMTGKGSAYPIESLTFYRIGSFPGVAPMAQLQMYAQSWALVNFLMEKYPNEFMAYQKKMAEKTAGEGEDIKWLLESLGKNKEEVDREFLEYMSTYKKIDDPDVKYFEELYNIFMRD